MNFNLSQKIEEVRQKPEHIRMRYVWTWLAISMVFIFGIWVFSVKESFKAVNFSKDSLPELDSGLSGLKDGMPSMDDFQKSSEQDGAMNEGFDSASQNTVKESISNLQNDPR